MIIRIETSGDELFDRGGDHSGGFDVGKVSKAGQHRQPVAGSRRAHR
jgi:hypothetical protein